MRLRFGTIFGKFAMVCMLIASASTAQADWVYVGSWQVDQGPGWGTFPAPAILTGQEAAALLFGGTASDYAISTIGNDPTLINHMTWYSPWGGSSDGYDSLPGPQYAFPAGVLATESTVVDNDGSGLYDYPGDLSSYVTDWAVGAMYTNYAFVQSTSTVPEPSSFALAGLGGLGLAFAGYRRRKAASA